MLYCDRKNAPFWRRSGRLRLRLKLDYGIKTLSYTESDASGAEDPIKDRNAP